LPLDTWTESEIRNWCLDYVKRTRDNPSIDVGPDVTFAEMGLDSATSAYFIVELEEWLGIELDPEIVFDYPTIADLARYVVTRQGGGHASID
jgi:acyl carrier protein